VPPAPRTQINAGIAGIEALAVFAVLAWLQCGPLAPTPRPTLKPHAKTLTPTLTPTLIPTLTPTLTPTLIPIPTLVHAATL
jgi:hypothetical protein